MSEAPNEPSTARFLQLSSLLAEWDADAAARHEAKTTGKPLGPIMGLPKLDAVLGGALLPGLHHLHGIPGVGKTALALQIAAGCGCPSLYVTAEMPALELLRRITARVTATFLGKFKSGELAPDYSGQLVRDAIQMVPQLALLDATQAPASAQQITDLTAFCRPPPPGLPHFLLIVDSLNSWAEGAYPGVVEYEQINMALADLRKIAAHFACPVLIINERNRATMDKGGQSAGAGSRKIEYGAESVIDLDIEKDAKADANGEKAVTLRVTKNRHGVTGNPVPLKFHGALQRYTEVPS